MNKTIQMAEIKLTNEEIQAAMEVMRSGALRQGKVCFEFEKQFAGMVGSKYALTCSSGTAALHLAYMACLKPNDEVLLPAFTFIATASMVTMIGAKPVFCDVDPETWVIDLKDVAQKITDKTKAIAPVHIFGNSCPIDEIQNFANENNLYIVWDAAQAHGTTYKGMDIGKFDDFVCYSFYPSKNIFIGEGGIVTTNNDNFAEKIKFLRTHGQTGKYYHTLLGLNYRMTDVEAAIGLKQLDRFQDMIKIRRRNGSILNEGLHEIEGISIQKVSNFSNHSYNQYCILVEKEQFGMDRDELASKLYDKRIASGIHYPRGLNRQPIFIDLYGEKSLPVTDKICEQILALPVHHGLNVEQCQRIIEGIRSLKS